MGTDAIGLPLLNLLGSADGDSIKLIGVITNPDRRTGRGLKVKQNPIKQWTLERGLSLLQPARVTQVEVDWLSETECELLVIMAYGHILGRAILDQPRLGVLNMHASLLPAYRGASPIEGAIAAGELETGVSLMQVVPRLDAGPVLDRETVKIEESDSTPTLAGRMAQVSLCLWEKNQASILSGEARFEEQREDLASYTRMLVKEDSGLDFRSTAKILADRIKALAGWPGSRLEIDGVNLKIGKAGVVPESSPESPGTIRMRDCGFTVATAAGLLRIDEIQRPGGKMLPASAFLRGYKIADGTVATSATMVPLFGKKPFRRKIAFTTSSE